MEENADSTKLEHLIRHVPTGQETVIDLMKVGGESVKTIEIRRRKLQPELPSQLPQEDIARAQARNHVFNDIETFADYLCREAHSENSVILADVDKRSITAVLNEGLETDREYVTLQAIEHPLFTESLLDDLVSKIKVDRY